MTLSVARSSSNAAQRSWVQGSLDSLHQLSGQRPVRTGCIAGGGWSEMPAAQTQRPWGDPSHSHRASRESWRPALPTWEQGGIQAHRQILPHGPILATHSSHVLGWEEAQHYSLGRPGSPCPQATSLWLGVRSVPEKGEPSPKPPEQMAVGGSPTSITPEEL